jgi:hypothetical protein
MMKIIFRHPLMKCVWWKNNFKISYKKTKKKKGKVVPLRSREAIFGWQEVQLLLFLNFGTRRGWVVSITLRPRFTAGKRTPRTHCIGGWMGPRAGLEAEIRGKTLRLCRGSIPGRPVRSQALYRLSYLGMEFWEKCPIRIKTVLQDTILEQVSHFKYLCDT